MALSDECIMRCGRLAVDQMVPETTDGLEDEQREYDETDYWVCHVELLGCYGNPDSEAGARDY